MSMTGIYLLKGEPIATVAGLTLSITQPNFWRNPFG